MNRKMFFAQNIMTPIEGLGYGYLYNWYAASHSNFAPNGWSLPSKTDFDTLVTYLGGSTIAGGKLKEASLNYWTAPNTGATNESGFTALPCGGRGIATGDFFGMYLQYLFWSITEIGSSVYYMNIYYNYAGANVSTTSNKGTGYGVRLIKDSTTLSDGETSTMTDEDGNVYDTICIGTQEWTVQNWKCTKLNDGTPLTKVTSNTTWATASTGDLYYCAYDNDESNV